MDWQSIWPAVNRLGKIQTIVISTKLLYLFQLVTRIRIDLSALFRKQVGVWIFDYSIHKIQTKALEVKMFLNFVMVFNFWKLKFFFVVSMFLK